MDRERKLPGGFDEHDVTRARFALEDWFRNKKNRRKLGCGCFAISLIVILLIVASIALPLIFGGGEVEYEDMGRPDAVERYIG
jgi:hypothetical protein